MLELGRLGSYICSHLHNSKAVFMIVGCSLLRFMLSNPSGEQFGFLHVETNIYVPE